MYLLMRYVGCNAALTIKYYSHRCSFSSLVNFDHSHSLIQRYKDLSNNLYKYNCFVVWVYSLLLTVEAIWERRKRPRTQGEPFEWEMHKNCLQARFLISEQALWSRVSRMWAEFEEILHNLPPLPLVEWKCTL